MDDKIFIPFSEDLLAAVGSPPGELVPYELNYRCLRLPNGVYEFTMEGAAELPRDQAALQQGALHIDLQANLQPNLQPSLQRAPGVVHAA